MNTDVKKTLLEILAKSQDGEPVKQVLALDEAQQCPVMDDSESADTHTCDALNWLLVAAASHAEDFDHVLRNLRYAQDQVRNALRAMETTIEIHGTK